MKTFEETITRTKPRLIIERDEFPESPREWSNLGYFITIDRDYKSPDNNRDIIEIIEEAGEDAEDCQDHMKRIKKEIKANLGEKVLAIYPVYKYEHSGVVYRRGEAHGFDYSNNGFYIITDKTQKEVGTKRKDFEKVIDEEIKLYNKWCAGEVYQFILYDEAGETVDSCSGFYNIEDIRDYLPEEWKDEDLDQYLSD